MLCLTMIVKDESAILRETLEAVKPLVDRWLIVDTGSTDQTCAVVEDVMRGVDGRLVHAEWAGFGPARTRAIEEARSLCGDVGWALVIDADSSVVHGGREGLWEQLKADSHDVEIRHGGVSWGMPCVLSLGLPWRWHGPVHEALVGQPWALPGDRIEGVRIEPRPGGARSRDPEKYRKDATVLARARVADPEWAPRWCFYEAQSWRDAGDDMTAAATYVERSTLGGYPDEVYVSLLEAGKCRARIGVDPVAVWWQAVDADRSRPEALCWMAEWARVKERWLLAFVCGREAARIADDDPHGLFVDLSCWQWRPWFELSVAAYWVGEKQVGLDASARVLADGRAPGPVLDRVTANLQFYA